MDHYSAYNLKIPTLYFVVKVNEGEKYKVFKLDITHKEVKKIVFELKNAFGRLDYANHWKDFYNGSISRQEHRRWLNR